LRRCICLAHHQPALENATTQQNTRKPPRNSSQHKCARKLHENKITSCNAHPAHKCDKRRDCFSNAGPTAHAQGAAACEANWSKKKVYHSFHAKISTCCHDAAVAPKQTTASVDFLPRATQRAFADAFTRTAFNLLLTRTQTCSGPEQKIAFPA
jgi:hypothetical protein